MYDNNDKLNLLWKRYRGVTPTSDLKSANNESLLSKQPTFQQNIWTDSDRIPTPAPGTSTVTGNELWSGVMLPKKGENAVQLVRDPTTNLTAFHAMTVPNAGIIEANRMVNWVPPQLDRSYTITVYAGKPGVVGSVKLSPLADGFEWEFDYSTGVLFFPNETPAIVKQGTVWIEGWIYTGEIGRGASGGGATNTSKIRTLTYTTAILDTGKTADFVMETGGKCILVEAKVSSPAVLECHAMSSRTDTNPYRFVAVDSHLVDDGSYVLAGMRYYGERFIPLINMEDTTSPNTYWRVKNDSAAPQSITVIIQVA